MFTAASRFCAAVLTWPRADTTPDTVLTPGLAPRLLTAVLSVSSVVLSALVCVWNWPCASVTSGSLLILARVCGMPGSSVVMCSGVRYDGTPTVSCGAGSFGGVCGAV